MLRIVLIYAYMGAVIMRLMKSKSPNAVSLYVIKTTNIKGRNSTKIVEKLGTCAQLKEKLGGEDPVEWAKRYIAELNRKEKEGEEPEVLVKYSPAKIIDKDKQRCFNGGYLFLQSIYHALGLDKICQKVADKHSFCFDLDSILSRLVYGRILFPASKLATLRLAEKFLEAPKFELQHLYRALSVLASDSDYIQSELYKNSGKLFPRRTGVIYYDCTNYYFEIEQEDEERRYGYSKEHRPNPIVQMGLFMDYDGIPLAFCINPGNTNEQLTLEPLEQKLLDDFDMSKFVVCTDAGLASNDNRMFNDKEDRAFITTQSIKKLKKYLREWALDPAGWKLKGDKHNKTYNLSEIEAEMETEPLQDRREIDDKYNRIFYKERGVKEDDLTQNLIVTYSVKYRDYQRKVRSDQINRAQRAITSDPGKLKKINANDYRRFIKRERLGKDGEKIQGKEHFIIDSDQIAKEAAYDGFYAVCTNLSDDAQRVADISHRRWEIEECFRIMKSEFKARPVFLRREERIKAHFLTCFISLLIYRILERKLQYKYSSSAIITELCGMNFLEQEGDGYIPDYTRTDMTDDLHQEFGFRTDYQIVTQKKMKEIFKKTRS